jgi:hypothetical protein
LSGKKP